MDRRFYHQLVGARKRLKAGDAHRGEQRRCIARDQRFDAVPTRPQLVGRLHTTLSACRNITDDRFVPITWKDRPSKRPLAMVRMVKQTSSKTGQFAQQFFSRDQPGCADSLARGPVVGIGFKHLSTVFTAFSLPAPGQHSWAHQKRAGRCK